MVILQGSETPECHALYVWEQYIYPARAKHIAIIAHSYGGCVTTSLVSRRLKVLDKYTVYADHDLDRKPVCL